jgi:hypothetical protein
MIAALIARLLTAAPTVGMHPEICPPRVGLGERMRRELRDWLDAPLSPDAATPLEAARHDFVDALDGVAPGDAWRLLDRIADATSLRELWHLRVEVFERVALSFDQIEADERLARLNRHFPTRSPRSGFGSL